MFEFHQMHLSKCQLAANQLCHATSALAGSGMITMTDDDNEDDDYLSENFLAIWSHYSRPRYLAFLPTAISASYLPTHTHTHTTTTCLGFVFRLPKNTVVSLCFILIHIRSRMIIIQIYSAMNSPVRYAKF